MNYSVTLTQMYTENRDYVERSGFVVTVCESMPWVEIKGEDEDEQVFLQGDEAQKYIDEAREVWKKAGDLGLDAAFTGHARQYIDCLFT